MEIRQYLRENGIQITRCGENINWITQSGNSRLFMADSFGKIIGWQ
jgi:hypothetical protein